VNIYGNISHPGLIEQAAAERLRVWLPHYLAEVERQHNREVGKLRLRSIVTVSELDRFPEDQLPCAVVISPGTIDDPTKDGAGDYSALYNVSVAVLVSSTEAKGSRLLAQLFGAAVRGALMQNRQLTETVSIEDWLGESFDDLPVEERRTLFGGINSFSAELLNVVNWKAGPPGPADPPDDPTADPPEPVVATDVQVEVTKETT
jgi:hypothetical protein